MGEVKGVEEVGVDLRVGARGVEGIEGAFEENGKFITSNLASSRR